MNLSGIVVAVPPNRLNESIDALTAIDNIEIHQSDESTGQIVIVQEANNVNMEIDGLKRIKALPMVTYAEMVYHYIEDDTNPDITLPDDIESSNLDDTLRKLNN
ncbi:MAG: chaperone NapD [Cocleimonas sp.]